MPARASKPSSTAWRAESSRAQLLALSPEERATLLQSLPDRDAELLLCDWAGLWARQEQLPPPGDWRVWLILSGRGFGKTRAGAEWVRAQVESGRYGRLALIGPTAADVRDVMVEGESGLRAIAPSWLRPEYQPTRRRVYWPHNGATAMLYSAEEPDRLRGPQHDAGWADELCAWQYPDETWNMFLFGLRLGEDPRAVVTTTPRPVQVLRDLLKQRTTVKTGGSTYENVANLAPAFAEQIVAKFEGTRLGQQELYAEILEDTPGALWKRDQLEKLRVTQYPRLVRVVVAVDPEASSDEGAAETGIVVAGVGTDGHGYVVDDRSIRATPDAWARAAVTAYHTWEADRLCGEVNNGGEMVEHTIRTVDNTVAYKALHASRGKAARAEPVAALYEQGRVHHVGYFNQLEDQLCTWVAGEKSPDRLDALVWAVTELMLVSSYGSMPMAVADSAPEGWAGVIQRAAQGQAATDAPPDDTQSDEQREASIQHQANLARVLQRLDGMRNPWG